MFASKTNAVFTRLFNVSTIKCAYTSFRKISTFSSLLNSSQLDIVAEQKVLLLELQKTLSLMHQDDHNREDVDLVKDTAARIVDFFTVVIVGKSITES